MYVTTANIARTASKSCGMINDVNKSYIQGISDTLLRFNSNKFNINIIFYYDIHISPALFSQALRRKCLSTGHTCR